MNTCIACGMPLEGAHVEDVGMQTPEGPVCKFDLKDGVLKEPAEIFQGGVMFFASSVAEGDQVLAERLTRKNMKALPHWQAHLFPLLDGSEATDEEFSAAMAKLSAH